MFFIPGRMPRKTYIKRCYLFSRGPQVALNRSFGPTSAGGPLRLVPTATSVLPHFFSKKKKKVIFYFHTNWHFILFLSHILSTDNYILVFSLLQFRHTSRCFYVLPATFIFQRFKNDFCVLRFYVTLKSAHN